MIRAGALLAAIGMLLAVPAPSAAQLSSFCSTVAATDGVCEVYENKRGPSWAKRFHRLIDSSQFNKAVAVVLGVSEYHPDFGNLSAPAREARLMRNFLVDEAGFDIVVMLTDKAVTRQRVDRLMSEIIPPLLGPRDRFLFYFSGHGDTEELPFDRQRGFLVTSEARKNNWSRMISMKSVQDWSYSIARARQSLWLIDACFSGLANAQTMNRIRNRTRQRLSQRGHHLITAGLKGEESLIVNGRSLFISAFLEAARQADRSSANLPADGLISLYEMQLHIGAYLDREISRLNADRFGTHFKMSPQLSVLHDDAGQFFFPNLAWNNPGPPRAERREGAVVERKAVRDSRERAWHGTGRSWIVDQGGSGDHRTISAAIAKASPGDIIRVRPGRYKEGLVIDKNLEIFGDGPRDQITVETSNKITVHFKAKNGRLAGLTLRRNAGEYESAAVFIPQGRLFLENNDIRSDSLAGVEVTGDETDPTIAGNRIHSGKISGLFIHKKAHGTIEDNQIFNNSNAGISVGNGGDPVIRGNRIHGQKAAGIFVYKNGRGTIENNEIYNNAFYGVEIREGGDPIVRRNRITENMLQAVRVYKGGRGTFLDNDLRGNKSGAWRIDSSAGTVNRQRNKS